MYLHATHLGPTLSHSVDSWTLPSKHKLENRLKPIKLPDLAPHTPGFIKSAVAWHQAVILIGKDELKVPTNIICPGHWSLSQKALYWSLFLVLTTPEAAVDRTTMDSRVSSIWLPIYGVHWTCVTPALISQTVFWSPGPRLNLFTHNRQKQVWA